MTSLEEKARNYPALDGSQEYFEIELFKPTSRDLYCPSRILFNDRPPFWEVATCQTQYTIQLQLHRQRRGPSSCLNAVRHLTILAPWWPNDEVRHRHNDRAEFI